MTFRFIAVLIAVTVAAGLAANPITDSGSDDAGHAESLESVAAPLAVAVVAVERASSYDVVRRFTGTIAARRTSEVGFERSARLVEVLVDEGAVVHAGDPLARLDTRRLKTRRDELQAERAQASAVQDELEAGPRAQEIAAARANVNDLNAQVDLQARTRERTQGLFDRKAAARKQLDDDELLLESIKARRDAAKERFSELEEGTRQEQITAQRSVVARLDAQLDDLAIEIEDSILAAPFGGRIAERYVDEGTFVSPGQPIVRLVESGSLEARIGLPVESASRLTAGEATEILVHGRIWKASVDEALPELDLATRTRTVVFCLEAVAAESIVPGEIARVEMRENEPTDGFWLPTSALTPGPRGLWSVLAVVDGRVERRDVEILHAAADRTFGRGMLTDGDVIVTGGTQRVVAGQRVRGGGVVR